MNELKPEEVMKALEDWSYNLCVSCKTEVDCEKCVSMLLKNALALIREKDAEIERLKNRITCQVILPDEKLEEIKNECLERVELDIKEIKAEAVRKMVERLKKRLPVISPIIFDQIAKEVVEGNE